jgi:hypothetical protein
VCATQSRAAATKEEEHAMLSPVSYAKPVATPSFAPPSKADLKGAAEALVDSRNPIRSQMKAPVKHPERYLHTPIGDVDADRAREAYLIKGRLWVAETGFTGLTQWSNYGPLVF